MPGGGGTRTVPRPGECLQNNVFFAGAMAALGEVVTDQQTRIEELEEKLDTGGKAKTKA